MGKQTKFIVGIVAFCIGSLAIAQDRALNERPATGTSVAQALEKSLSTKEFKKLSNTADTAGLIKLLQKNGANGNIQLGATIIGTEKEKNPNGCYPYVYLALPFNPKIGPQWVAGYICPPPDSLSNH